MSDEPIVQIHHLEMDTEVKYTWDKDLGAVQRTQQFARKSTVDRIVHDGNTYEVGPDLTFRVPSSVGAFMTRMPNWHYGPSPLAPEPVVDTPAIKSRQKVAAA